MACEPGALKWRDILNWICRNFLGFITPAIKLAQKFSPSISQGEQQ
ncbi:hypothetical protein CHISP_3237 [Chitinispirillum alkaliphilum]|nr:hypothetical protein CHISP_3237 [Chitinispirillum alkaliphilum]